MYITNSEQFPDDIRQLLSSDQELMISGRPLAHYTSNGKEFFFNACQPVPAMVFVPQLAIMHMVPDIGHRHLGEEYRGTYPVITGHCPQTGDEYRFGVRTVLDFGLRAIDTLVED